MKFKLEKGQYLRYLLQNNSNNNNINENDNDRRGLQNMSNAQILVVEDEYIVAKDIQNSLEKLGYTVPAIAASGEEAINKIREIQPSLVLMDIVLKGTMDGVETANQIRTKFDIPIIYLTAYSDEKTLQRAKITEPFGYLLKPFEERELYSTIEMALYKQEMEKEHLKRP